MAFMRRFKAFLPRGEQDVRPRVQLPGPPMYLSAQHSVFLQEQGNMHVWLPTSVSVHDQRPLGTERIFVSLLGKNIAMQ